MIRAHITPAMAHVVRLATRVPGHAQPVAAKALEGDGGSQTIPKQVSKPGRPAEP